MTRLGSEVITVVHAVLVQDVHDNSEYRDWDNATRSPISGCMVQPFLLSNKLVQEDSLQREFTREFYRIWMPAGTVVEYTDRLEWRDANMEIFGPAQRWHTISGTPHHIQLLGVVYLG